MTEELPLAADKAPVQTETVEQAEERVLESLIGSDTKKPEPVEAKATEHPEEKPEDGASEDDAGESADEGDLEKAITSLRRGKVPQTVLKKMSNREIIAMSKDMTERQAEVDNAFRELGELRKSKQQAESRKESQAEPANNPSDDLDKELDALFDPETGKALKSVTQRAIETHTKALKEELSSMSNLVERLLTKEIRGDLRESFPDVDDASKWAKVQEKASTLAKTGDYAGSEDPMRAVFEDAARLVLKPKASDESKTDTSSRAKSNGQPATKSRQVPTKALTAEEREDAALDALLRGGSRDDAKKAWGG